MVSNEDPGRHLSDAECTVRKRHRVLLQDKYYAPKLEPYKVVAQVITTEVRTWTPWEGALEKLCSGWEGGLI